MDSLSDADVGDLGDFLIEKGVPADIVITFTENMIDGEAFLELTESDIKDLVKPLGIVKKIVRILREVKEASQAELTPDPVLHDNTGLSTSILGTPPAILSPSVSIISTCSEQSQRSSNEHNETRLFTMPNKWRPSIMFAIKESKLTPDVRNEVVRDLVTHMYSYVERPTSAFCKFVAQRLILQFPFMRDSMGTGFGSWEKKIIERVSNVHRKRINELDQNDSTPNKRGRPKKTSMCLNDRYPNTRLNENVSPEEERSATDALRREMSLNRPRKDIYLPLMRTTFPLRRHYIMHHASSVGDILQEYPALMESKVIEQEMEFILGRPAVVTIFDAEWRMKWVPAITTYCNGLKKLNTFISSHMENNSSVDEWSEEKLAFCLLVPLFTAKKHDDIISTIYEKCLIGEDPDMIAKRPPVRNSPRFAEFDVDDGENSYFIFVEQKTVCKTSSFTRAVFLWFAVHYVFHLSYSKPLSDLCTFVQEFVFGLPSTGKRSTSYLTTATDIQQNTVR